MKRHVVSGCFRLLIINCLFVLSGTCQVNPVDFGADPTGKKSSTEAINKCLLYVKVKGIRDLVFSKGTYLIEPAEMDAKFGSYGIKIDDLHGVSFSADDGVVLVNGVANEEEGLLSFFFITNSTKLSFQNFSFQNKYGTERIQKRHLYNGSAFFVSKSSEVNFTGNSFDNNYYGVCSFNSSNIVIQRNTFINGSYYARVNRPLSAFLLFSTSKSKIVDNVIYGGLGDGDLSLFGTGTDDCVIEGNKLYGFAYKDSEKKIDRLEQGITIDQGPKRNIIRNNLVHGYFYGIDVKADTYNNTVSSNQIIFCKVAVAERKGEARHVSYSSNNRVAGNTITMGGNWRNKYLLWGKYEAVGLLSENRANIDWESNVILVDDETRSCTPLAVVDTEPIRRTSKDKLLIRSNKISSKGCLGLGSYLVFFRSVKSPIAFESNEIFIDKCESRLTDKKIIDFVGEKINSSFEGNTVNRQIDNFFKQ